MATRGPPKTLDYDPEEITLLRDLFKFMSKHHDLAEDEPGYVPSDRIVEQFSVCRTFYKRQRKKH